MLTAETVRQLLDYDPATGVFIWRPRAHQDGNTQYFNRRFAGKRAGRSGKSKYDSICISGPRYYVHRLAWLYMTGKWPVAEIDHINGDCRDNRFENLREATHAENMRNSKMKKSNRHGLKGIVFIPKTGRYRANIRVNGKRITTYHETPEQAHEAYAKAANLYYGEFARTE